MICYRCGMDKPESEMHPRTMGALKGQSSTVCRSCWSHMQSVNATRRHANVERGHHGPADGPVGGVTWRDPEPVRLTVSEIKGRLRAKAGIA